MYLHVSRSCFRLFYEVSIANSFIIGIWIRCLLGLCLNTNLSMMNYQVLKEILKCSTVNAQFQISSMVV